ncbi:rod shape-determining protein MreD [Prolixibacteraceae bacterium JC049]|nr:rod shape-determining protein MreD [Prolixibacteraceae bacterium JC049]
MIDGVVKYILLFFGVILLQVLILNNVQFSGLINPFAYILIILLLPIEMPTWWLMIIGFFTGLSVDVFSNTPGLHASATVFAAFIRPKILDLLSSRDEYEVGKPPRIYNYGFNWFLRYTAIIVVAHHTVLFLLEAFTWRGMGDTLLRVLASSVFSIVLIILLQLLFNKK